LFNYDLPQGIENQMREHKFSGLIDVEEIATAWEEIRSSIESLYAAADQLEMAINRQQYNEMNSVSRYKQRLKQIEVALNIANSGNIDFSSDMEHDQELYTCRMIHPDENGKLILPEARSINYLPKARLEFGYRHGSHTEDSGIENLKQGKQWRAVARVTRPTVIEPTEGFYGITTGAPLLLNIYFNQPYRINCITITPASQFPMDLIAVSLYEPDGNEQVLLAPAGWNIGWHSTVMFTPVYMRFPYKTVTGVSLLLNQRHYTKQEDAATRRVWYEYELSLDRLFVGAIDYHPEGQWVSAPIENNSIINSIQIETVEEYGIYPGTNIAANMETSIEYDVSVDGYNWFPILPARQTRVERELLRISGGDEKRTAILRFPVNGNLAVYCDHVMLKPGIDYSLVDSRTIVFHSRYPGVLTAKYDPDESAQTVNLLTGEHLTEVTEEFAGTNEDKTITLAANVYINNRLIELLPDDWNPSYLDSQYVPIKVSIRTPDGRVLTQPATAGGEGIYNVTAYRSGTLVTGQINYTCSGRTITFDQKIDGDSTITVTYWKALERARVRATLLRHSRKLTGITPEIAGIKIIMH